MKIATLILALALCTAPSVAGEHQLLLESERIAVRFVVDATLHKVHGSARLKSGELRFDPETGSVVGELVVDATSLETGNRKRDRQMHRKVLDSATYPEIVFRPNEFEGGFALDRGPMKLVVTGVMSLRGTDHELEIPVELAAEGDDFRFKTAFRVPYVSWGLPNPSRLLLRVAKEVEIAIDGLVSIEAPD